MLSKRKIFFAIILFTVVFILFIFAKTTSDKKKVLVADTPVSVEIASSQEQKVQGLSGRNSLGKNEGMLFVYTEKGHYDFWMKGMKFPLDFIWIAENRVLDLTENAPVENKPDNQMTIYRPKTQVDQILEVNAGFIKEHNIKIGSSFTNL